jgi:hypothetical protein
MAEGVKLVALYNVRRGMKAVYMILNPQRSRCFWFSVFAGTTKESRRTVSASQRSLASVV